MALNVVIIGAGRMGREHAAAATAAGDKVIAVLDADIARAGALAGEHGAVVATAVALGDTLDALAHGDGDGDMAVIVASPSSFHLDHALVAIGRGASVLVEKPPWVPGQDPAPLLSAASNSSALTAVGMTTRFSPGVQALRRAVRSGQLGSVMWVSDLVAFSLAGDSGLPAWYFDPGFSGGGVLVTNGVHSIDRVSWVLGEPLVLETARKSSGWLHDCEDTASLMLRAGGAAVSITELWSLGPVPTSQLLVVGDRGSAWTDAQGNWSVSSREGATSGSPPRCYTNLGAQWRSFRNAVGSNARDDALPTLADLLPAMRVLAQAMG